MRTLEQEKEELKTVATALLKALYVVSRSEGSLSGMPRSHEDLIDQYLSDASHIIDTEAKAVVDRDLNALHNTQSTP